MSILTGLSRLSGCKKDMFLGVHPRIQILNGIRGFQTGLKGTVVLYSAAMVIQEDVYRGDFFNAAGKVSYNR